VNEFVRCAAPTFFLEVQKRFPIFPRPVAESSEPYLLPHFHFHYSDSHFVFILLERIHRTFFLSSYSDAVNSVHFAVDDTTYSAFADALAKNGGKTSGKVEEKAKKEEPKKADAPKASEPAKANGADMEKLKKEHADQVATKDAKIKELEDKVKELAKSTQDYKEKHSACLADKDNLVKITKRDVDAAKEFGIKQMVVKLFDVVDTLNICIDNTKEPNSTSHPGTEKTRFLCFW
jgi:hypothetical protein